ncbi:Homeobox protein aristaless-like 3 [Cichlidogyrus casuarinus]|uniref:Homeobox protein aristaless-like 3 n=1 Tax=Cichlidogyrus casuarinus TaxID=1844966 RepID=A0ABD2QMA9_9PLAT
MYCLTGAKSGVGEEVDIEAEAEASETDSQEAGSEPKRPRLSPSVQGSRRCRTTFSEAQVSMLEAAFQKHPYPDVQEQERLSSETDLAADKVQVWFSNRRARWRKQMLSQSAPSPGLANLLAFQKIPECEPPRRAPKASSFSAESLMASDEPKREVEVGKSNGIHEAEQRESTGAPSSNWLLNQFMQAMRAKP